MSPRQYQADWHYVDKSVHKIDGIRLEVTSQVLYIYMKKWDLVVDYAHSKCVLHLSVQM